MAHRSRTILAACAAFGLAACSAPTTKVTLRVTDDSGEAVPRARVLAIAIGTSSVPLPVTLDRLSEALTKTEQRGVTDARGEVDLRVLAEYVQYVQVLAPPTDLSAVEQSLDRNHAWYWYLNASPISVTEPPEAPNAPGLRLTLVHPTPASP